MLEKIRKSASSRIVQVLIILPLIVAFAIWGIEDMLRGFGRGDLAVVGNRTISTEEFQENYRLELDAMSRRFGRRLSAQQAQLLGVPNSVLSRMIGSAAVDQHAQSLGLTISENAVVRDIQRDPSFTDSAGNFNPDALNLVLRQSGLSEGRYIEERRRDALRSIITTPLIEAVAVPDSLLEMLHTYNNETRTVSYVVVPEKAVGEIKDPNDAALKAFYEQRKTDFKTPELRKISILFLRASDVKKTMSVADADIKNRYEENPDRFNEPEKREVEQIPFENKDAAEKALAEIKGGKDFLEVAKANNAKESDVKLGLLAKSQMIDQKIADAAFKLDANGVSDVVEGNFAPVLIRVVKIEPGKERTLDDVKDQIKTELINERIGEEVEKVVRQADDLRLSGKTPSEIAKELKLEFVEVPAVDRNGRDADGKPVPAVQGRDGRNILTTAFQGTVGVENETIELNGGGYAWVDLLEVSEEKQRAFSDVKDEVKTAWIAAERTKALRTLTDDLAKKVQDGQPLADVAKSLAEKPEVKTTKPVKRTDTVQGLPQAAIARAFSLAKGDAASVAGADGTSRLVIAVDDVTAPKPMTDEERKKLAETLGRQRSEDVLRQYLAKLRSEIDVNINTAVLNQTLGIRQQ